MARKILLSFTMALFAAALTIPASATCGLEGLHTSGGAVVSTAGNRATLGQQQSTGCYLYITNMWVSLVQTGTTAGTATLAVYKDMSCSSGNWYYNIQQLAVTGTQGDFKTWNWQANANGVVGNGALLMPQGFDICIGFGAGVTGIIESVGWNGYWSGSVL